MESILFFLLLLFIFFIMLFTTSRARRVMQQAWLKWQGEHRGTYEEFQDQWCTVYPDLFREWRPWKIGWILVFLGLVAWLVAVYVWLYNQL